MRKILYWGLITFLTLFVFLFFLNYSRVGTYDRASVAGLLSGTADKPYVQRVFLPLVANLLAPFVPLRFADWVKWVLEAYTGRNLFLILNGDLYPRQVVLILLEMYLSLLGFAIVTWKFLGVLGYGPRTRSLALPLILGVVPELTFGFGHIYDLPGAFLFSLALYFLYQENWFWYLLALALASLNKETAFFLIPIFGLYFWQRMKLGVFLRRLGLQIAIFVILRLAIMITFANNPGKNIEWHLQDNLQYLHENPAFLTMLMLVLVCLIFLIVYRWKEKPVFLRTSLIIFPFFVATYVFWGMLGELRVFLDVYLIAALLMLPPPANANLENRPQLSTEKIS